MKKKALSVILAVLMGATVLAGCGNSSSGSTGDKPAAAATEAPKEAAKEEATEAPKEETPAADAVELKVSHVFAEDHPVNKAFVAASEELSEKTGGRYKLTIYPNGTYANYADAITACQMGDVDIAALDSSSDWLPAGGVLFAPYCFESYDHWEKFKSSELCTEMRKEIGDAVGGVVQLNMYNFGFRNLTANKEIRTLDDFKGLTLRCVNFEPYSTLKDVFDVNITSIPIEDVYMSLQTGVADCEENPLTQIVTMKFYEVQSHLMMTKHMLACSSTIINKDLWDSLSPEDQAIFQEVFTNMGNKVDELTQTNEDKLIQECKDNGMTVIDDVDTTPFQENAAKVVSNYPEWQDWYDQIQAMK